MKPTNRLAIVTSHPIQYNAPLFKRLSEQFNIKVFYTLQKANEIVFDKQFGRFIDWDIPLLEGYSYTFVNNISPNPGSQHFNGVINPTLNEEVEEWKAEALLVYGWAFSSHLNAIRHFHKKIPVIFRGDSTLIDVPPGFAIKKIARKIFLTWVYSHVDYALYVGTANKKYFKVYGLKANQLLFAPHAVDNSRFVDKEIEYAERAKEWRSKLGIEENDIVFLFAAKLIEKKDPELLIEAFLALRHPGTWLIMVGDGELEIQLKSRYASFNTINFINFQNQSVMPVVYRLGDVFVLPSKGPSETWGLSINEAMACSRAVIASDKCGCSADIIIDDFNGYIFKSQNVESLKISMQKSILKFKELGNNSEQLIKDWNYSKTVDQLKKVFETISN
jgi:glycosyltransferase involved in cell wall biosynthesis